ncbi:hypothetical protein [Vibrio parahaemolyticus]|uniref:hypothetical protein n=1 Tax=Vibrio parahaemolyticus TaxID=670 RepID=UPI00301E592B
MPLSRESILSADDLKREEVQVPEWGGSVFVRVMGGSERDAFEAIHIQSPHKDFRARLTVQTACDENGVRLFTDADIDALGKKSAAAIDKVFAVSCRINGLTKQDVEELGNA